MPTLILKQGEAKTLTLTVKDGSGAAVDLATATLLLGVKKSQSEAAEYPFSKDNAAFDRSQAAVGIVTVNLSGHGHQPGGNHLRRRAEVLLGRAAAGNCQKWRFLLPDQAGGDWLMGQDRIEVLLDRPARGD